jgi:hypothetical protein
MRTRVRIALACALSLGSAAGSVSAMTVTAASPPAQHITNRVASSRLTSDPVHFKHACAGAAGHGRDECFALLRTAADGAPLSTRAAIAAAPPAGYGPASLRAAYELATAAKQNGHGQTVYRKEYGLPGCTTANGCFRKVNQEGAASPLPEANPGWAVEESLDLDMVSAICPNCHILLVEGNDSSDYNLAAAVATAGRLKATEISNSYGEPEYPGIARLEHDFDQPTAKVTAASGDSGYGVSFPASSQYVTAVGGTTLYPADNSRGWAESVWLGSGSGCSAVIPKPSWQHDSCAHRTDNDVAAVADPDTPVAIYDSYQGGGWDQVGGTSVGSPLVAAVYALVGSATRGYPDGSYFYSHKQDLFPVTTGSNGTCTPAYLCTGGPGYNGPTGFGTPDFTGVKSTGGSCVSGFSAAATQPLDEPARLLAGGRSITYDPAIATLSPTDVWTAGYYMDSGHSGPAISYGTMPTLYNWNGSRWRSYPAPDFVNGDGASLSEFTALSFDKPNDGWAAGTSQQNPMVAHWNGSTWAASPALDPVELLSQNGITAQAWTQTTAIAALSPSDVWLTGAVIDQFGDTAKQASFIEHWNGASWSLVPFPAAGSTQLTALHAFSATDIWAAGKGSQTGVILHWNGKQWLNSPLAPKSGLVNFYGMSGSSPDDLWATGQQFSHQTGAIQYWLPFTEHWNGHSWATVRIPGADRVWGPGTGFYSIDAISSTDAYAAGGWWEGSGVRTLSSAYLLAHWNGTRWKLLPSPPSPTPNGLDSVSASSASNVWISGAQIEGSYQVPFLLKSGCSR